MVRKNNGRRKIEMVKMKNESNLQVTFSKRRAGLFKKANELCTLCGIDIALIVFSPGGKVFSFGHPNLDLLLDRFSGLVEDSPPRDTNNFGLSDNNTSLCIQNLNEMLTKVLAAKEEEKAKKLKNKIIRKEMLEKNPEHWYLNPPEEFNLSQALQMKNVVEDFMKKLDDLYPQVNPTIVPNPNFYVGSSSNAAPGPTTVHHGGNIYTNPNFYVGSSSNVAPGPTTVRHGGNIYTNQVSPFGYDPNMITPNQTMPFGYNPNNNNNISEGFFPDNVMNPGYNQSQGPNMNQFEQGHPHYGNRYY